MQSWTIDPLEDYSLSRTLIHLININLEKFLLKKMIIYIVKSMKRIIFIENYNGFTLIIFEFFKKL